MGLLKPPSQDEGARVSSSPQPCQDLLLFIFLIFVSLTGMRGRLTLLWIQTSLVIDDIELFGSVLTSGKTLVFLTEPLCRSASRFEIWFCLARPWLEFLVCSGYELHARWASWEYFSYSADCSLALSMVSLAVVSQMWKHKCVSAKEIQFFLWVCSLCFCGLPQKILVSYVVWYQGNEGLVEWSW